MTVCRMDIHLHAALLPSGLKVLLLELLLAHLFLLWLLGGLGEGLLLLDEDNLDVAG